MNITITCPSLSPNGGIRVIVELANRLSNFYNVNLFLQDARPNNLFKVKVPIITSEKDLVSTDLLIITSPHSIHLSELKIKARIICFVQMLEHLFQPRNDSFKNKCFKFYRDFETITISNWGRNELIKFGNNKKIHYLGNGVNFEDFPITPTKKNNKIILLESPEPTNPTKDKNRIAIKVGKILEGKGYKLIGYGAVKPKEIDEFYVNPSLELMNELYRRATIMLKATLYDFRSTSPLEAATKGCVTARAITQGDDDLIDRVNCRKVVYNEMALLDAALFLLENPNERREYANNFQNYLKEHSWDYYIEQYKKIIG